ncbi:MAG: hypothetical protein QXJ86_03770 [Nitrososphaerales archaeon]
MDNARERRLTNAKIEIQSAYTILEQIQTSSKSFDEYKLDLWKARSRLELAILLIKLAANIDHEDRRRLFILRDEPHTLLNKAKEMLCEALKNFQNINTTLEKVRRVRDLLLLLETSV